MGTLEQIHIAVETALGNQHRAETLNRHVGQCQQPVEADVESIAKHPAIVVLQRFLRRWQNRSDRVVDQIENQAGVAGAIPQRIELLQCTDAGGVGALAALLIDIVFEITGQRSGDLDSLLRQKVGQILLPGLEEDREIAPVDHPNAGLARSTNQAPEMRIQFGRTAGEIERRGLAGFQCTDDRIDRLGIH